MSHLVSHPRTREKVTVSWEFGFRHCFVMKNNMRGWGGAPHVLVLGNCVGGDLFGALGAAVQGADYETGDKYDEKQGGCADGPPINDARLDPHLVIHK